MAITRVLQDLFAAADNDPRMCESGGKKRDGEERRDYAAVDIPNPCRKQIHPPTCPVPFQPSWSLTKNSAK